MDRIEELNKLRKLMGTLSEDNSKLSTKFYRGVEGIQVDLIDGPINPYKAIYCMAVSTWGSYKNSVIKRWEETSVEGRIAVVKAVLNREALPTAMEAPKFTFEVRNLSRWSFDQLARLRIGGGVASLGTRDNNHLDIDFRFHESSWKDPDKLQLLKENALNSKEVYKKIIDQGKGSWQEGRTALPISCMHRFTITINYLALRGLCANRMCFAEAEDTVAVAWLLRDRLLKNDAYPLLASYLRPGCDYTGKCNYHKLHTMSEAFGCLFKSCGRNERGNNENNLQYAYATFNESCSDKETIEKQLNIIIPDNYSGIENVLNERDYELFKS